MNRPLFSCVIPVKGVRPFLDEALASLLAQGVGQELEIIVQDADIEPDSGQSDAFNKGFAKAKGEWLFWLNSNDLLLPGALKKVKTLIDYRKAPIDLNWIAGNEYFIDADGKRVGCSIGNRWHDWLYRHAVPHVHGPSSFFRRELLSRVGGFDVALHYCMDWDLWIRFMQSGARCERIGSFLWAQRRWEGSKTQRIGGVSGAELRKHQAEIGAMLRRRSKITTTLNAIPDSCPCYNMTHGQHVKRDLRNQQNRHRKFLSGTLGQDRNEKPGTCGCCAG